MDKREAQQILDEFVAALQPLLSYRDWQKLVGESEVVEIERPSGVIYQIEWEAIWDSQPGGDILVLLSIDDGSLLGSIVPLNTSFIVSLAAGT